MKHSNACLFVVALTLTSLLSSCGGEGYGRYWLMADNDSSYVTIEGQKWWVKTAPNGRELSLQSQHPFQFTIGRGIDRKYPQWIYIHEIKDNGLVNITFDTQSDKSAVYPIYTGATGSRFTPFSQVWDVSQSTNVAFPDNNWLVLHRWHPNGIYADIASHLDPNDPTKWEMIALDILLPHDGTPVEIPFLNIQAEVVNFNQGNLTGQVRFSQL